MIKNLLNIQRFYNTFVRLKVANAIKNKYY
jgi:hypothetical protein